ncbi:MAG: Holliday junction resolvase RuvX [Ruminococcus sp.]|nr:Holliday junction resolvase RuvX [Ruminococcus sp.]
MIIISIDYGDVRTGVAACDTSEIMAFPVCTIEERNFERLCAKIADIAKNRKAEIIVVGNPVNMNGSVGVRSQKCTELHDSLAALTGLEAVLWDERRSTVEAANLLNQADVRGKKRKAVIDAAAACLILEGFLAFRKKSLNYEKE